MSLLFGGLLLYVPPLLDIGRLDVKAVAAITMVEVFVAAVSGVIAHGRHHAVDVRLGAIGGVAMAAGSLVGAAASHWMREFWLLIVFALMVTVAFVLMFLPMPEPQVMASAEEREYNRPLTALGSSVVGLGAGIVGAGGAFLFD